MITDANLRRDIENFEARVRQLVQDYPNIPPHYISESLEWLSENI